MARTDRKTLERTRMRVLAYLAVRAEENSGQGTSFGLMTRSLALTEGRVRSACRALQGEGLIVVEARFDEDGGQRANRYVLTKAGYEVLQDEIDAAARRLEVRPGPVEARRREGPRRDEALRKPDGRDVGRRPCRE